MYHHHPCCYHLLLIGLIFPRLRCRLERELVSLLTLPGLRFIDTLDASIRASKGRVLTTVEEVNDRVIDLAATQRQDAHKIYVWSRSKDRSMALEALIRAQEAHTTALEAQVGTLQTQHDRMEWQRQEAGDMVTSAFGCIHSLEARDPTHHNSVEDTENGLKKTTTPMTDAAIKQLIAQGVVDVLAEYEATRNSGNGDDSHDSGNGRRIERATRECTYSDFLKCQYLNFKGTEGVVSLTNALTWWNSHVKTIGHDAAYGMTWKTLKKMMTNSYTQHFQELALMCGRMFPKESDEVEKYIGGLPDMIQGSVMASKPKTMQGVVSYTQRFQELALMCGRMFPEESNEIEKYVGGLADMIQGSVMASKLKTMQDAIEFEINLMDQKICTFAKRQAQNKRKLDDNSRNNHTQQQPHKR
ncbi:hypothetical protein Tco_0944331 [Tanacetum coccineum]